MDEKQPTAKKGSLVATGLFSVAFIIYTFLFISDFKDSTTSKNAIRGILAGLFGLLAVINYIKYSRTK